jgi:hypothetical protein
VLFSLADYNECLHSFLGDILKRFPIRTLAGNIPIYCVIAEFVGVALFQFLGAATDANSASSGAIIYSIPSI